jgi:hypothetical protein
MTFNARPSSLYALIASLLVFSACARSATQATSPNETENATGSSSDPSKPVGPRAVNAGAKLTSSLIDDFEDGNNQSILADARGGYWYTYADKEGTTIEPAGNFSATEGGANDSKHSGRMVGVLASAQIVYAGMGVSFTEPKRPYDASSCAGVSFQARKSGEGTASVRLKVGDWQTSPEGNLCKQCYNDFGADFTFTDEWKEYSVLFSEMKQEPYWGEPKASIDAAALYQIQWQVKAPGSAFDISVDDVKFIGCEK